VTPGFLSRYTWSEAALRVKASAGISNAGGGKVGRGFLSGLIWGAILSGSVLIIASNVADYTSLSLPKPEVEAVQMPEGSRFDENRPESQPSIPQTEDRPAGDVAPEPVPPQPPAPAAPLADTSSAAQPETSVPEPGLQAPAISAEPGMSVAQDDAVLPSPAAAPPTVPSADLAPVPEAEVEADAEAAPETGPSPVTDAPPAALPGAPPTLRLPVPEIENLAPGVTTDRLPRIGAGDTASVEAAPQQPAIERFAQPFLNDAGSPLMALVLLVTPDSPEPNGLAGFPVPLTLAIDPTVEDAAALGAAVRAAGHEVALLAPLPEGAAPSDVEVVFQSYLSTLPEAVAVLDTPDARLQESRPLATQVVDILAAPGLGMITYAKGLNAALQIADSADVPATLVFREFDDGARDAAAMKRFLDQGAFRASQDGKVVMIGVLRPETLTAVTEWALGNRAATVALAPVSATLTAR
jgi:hypothetical protein